MPSAYDLFEATREAVDAFMAQDRADSRCTACDKEFPLPWRDRYACCNGNDCGCYGAVIPESFCSLACYENYDPQPYCSGCGAMKKSDCDCGPIAENN